MDSEDEEFDVFKAKKWRGNRKSSFAQVFHARERDQQGAKVPSKTGGDQRVVRKSQIIAESQNKGGINPLALMEFKKAFDANNHGELNKVNFIKTCKGIHDIASEMSDEEMESFFMKIDVNNKGVVDWDDFTTFILLQQLAKENEPGSETATYVKMKNTGKKGSLDEDVSDSDLSEDEDKPVHPRPILKNYKVVNTTLERPGNTIERIIFLNHIQTYVTATQDGMLNLWHADSLKLLRSQRNGTGAWITDVVAMAQQPLAVFAMDQSLTFYDTGRLSFDVLGCIEDLKSGPLCATWLRTPECDKLLYGDDRGYLHMFDFSDEWGGENPRVAPGVSQDMLLGMSEKLPWRIHTSWITKIKYLAHSSSLLSCSMDSTLLMLDLDKEKKKWSAKEHSHGIYTLDYCRFFLLEVLFLSHGIRGSLARHDHAKRAPHFTVLLSVRS